MKFALFANTDWYLYNFRLSTALRLKAEGHEVVMISPPGSFGERFAAHGLSWVTFDMRRESLNPWRELVTLYRLVRILLREKPGLLHSFTLKCTVYGAIAGTLARVPANASAIAGMGSVFSSRSLKARLLRPVLSGMLRLALARKRSLLILQNGDDARELVAHGLVKQHKIRVIRSSGVNTDRFHPAEKRATDRSPLRVVLAARLLREKGVQDFVDAAALLRDQGKDVECYLAGLPDPGNPHSVTMEQAQAWADAGLVRWLGHVDDMASLLKAMDVMALPSYYREGVPKSLIEGAACGLAIITTDLPGCREVVTEDAVDGLHVAPRNAEQLALKISELDHDRELLQRLGRNARNKALDHFDERLVIQRTLDVYGELLHGPGNTDWVADLTAQR